MKGSFCFSLLTQLSILLHLSRAPTPESCCLHASHCWLRSVFLLPLLKEESFYFWLQTLWTVKRSISPFKLKTRRMAGFTVLYCSFSLWTAAIYAITIVREWMGVQDLTSFFFIWKSWKVENWQKKIHLYLMKGHCLYKSQICTLFTIIPNPVPIECSNDQGPGPGNF